MYVSLKKDLYADLMRIEERGKRNSRKNSFFGFLFSGKDDDEDDRDD